MLASDLPVKFPIPWANSATPGTGVRAIPTASQISTQPGAASLTDGFPPLNLTPVAAGGIPPFAQDMNGILQQVTAWLRWSSSGGPIAYDAAYATAIGGYPAGALVQSKSGHAWYENLTDSNTTDPNVGGAGWRIALSVWSAAAWGATGSANAQSITFSPAAASTALLTGIPFTFVSVGTNTAAVTLNINALGAFPLRASNLTTLGAGALVTGGHYQAVFDGVGFHMLTQTPVFTDPGQAGLTIAGAGTSGANLALLGNGATTPNKFIRAVSGTLQFLNSAYTTVLATFTDAGVLNTAAGINANTGDITSSAGRLRAALGAFGSGDNNSGVLLGDFLETGNANGWVRREPDGLLVMGAKVLITGNNSPVTITLPTAFHTQLLGVTASYGVNLSLGVPVGTLGAEAGIDLGSIIMCSNTNPVQSNGVYYVAWGI